MPSRWPVDLELSMPFPSPGLSLMVHWFPQHLGVQLPMTDSIPWSSPNSSYAVFRTPCAEHIPGKSSFPLHTLKYHFRRTCVILLYSICDQRVIHAIDSHSVPSLWNFNLHGNQQHSCGIPVATPMFGTKYLLNVRLQIEAEITDCCDKKYNGLSYKKDTNTLNGGKAFFCG